jgi:hypothetical protein
MSAKATNALAFYTIAQMEQHVSLIKEGATEKVVTIDSASEANIQQKFWF